MKACIVNCAEYPSLLKTIENMVVNGKLSIEKIIDYSEYESMYGSFHGEFVSFYDHIRLRSDKSIEHDEYRYLSQGAISFAEKFQKTAMDILIFRHVRPGVYFKSDEATALFYSSLNRSIFEIQSNKLELIIFNHIPHHFNTFVLYVAAKFLNVKTLMVTKMSWNGFRYFLDTNVGERGWSIKNKIQCSGFVRDEDRLQIETIRSRINYSPPLYMSRQYRRKLVSFLSKYCSGFILFHVGIAIYGGLEIGFFKRMPCHFKWFPKDRYDSEMYPLKLFQVASQIKDKFKIQRLAKIYSKLSSTLNKFSNLDYVLFAPNYQPEATTLPSAFYFSDILLCIKLLRSRIPEEIFIVYKEHEDIFNINLEANRCRSKSFYGDILKIKNLIIVDRKLNQIELIDNSKFVVIQTSNIGLEAAVRGKPVLSFGPTWFDNFYNVMRWPEFDEVNGYQKMISLNVSENFNDKILADINKYTVRLEDSDKLEEVTMQMEGLFTEALMLP